MKLLVTGNGFDLAHGLPVKYTDMLDALFDPTLYKKNHPTYSLDWLGAASKEKYSNVELFQHFNSCRNLTGWAGFENELQSIINYFVSYNLQSQHSSPFSSSRNNSSEIQYLQLGSIYINYITKNTSLAWKQLSEQLNEICNFINLYITNLKMDLYSIPNLNALRPIYSEKYGLYLTFNYSDTFQQNFNTLTKLLSISGNSFLSSNPVDKHSHFIHGLAGSSRSSQQNTGSLSPLVLGIHNDVSKIDPSDIDQINRLPFEKSYQRIQKQTGRKYRQWFENPSHEYGNYSSIFTDIYGHSLDVADHDVLNFIIEHSKTSRIFYLNQTDYEQKIINLVKMYGSMTEVEDRFYSGKILFEQIPT